MSYIEMKIKDVIENLEETGYDFELVALRLAMSLKEVKELATEFGDYEEYESND